MHLIRCDLIHLLPVNITQYRARVKRHDPHPVLGDVPESKTSSTITSLVKSIDFERGIIITQNNIYYFGPRMPNLDGG